MLSETSRTGPTVVTCSTPRSQPGKKVKDKATEVLAEFGLTVSDVVRMTLTRVARDRSIPLELKVPNAETRAAMRESRARMKRFYSNHR